MLSTTDRQFIEQNLNADIASLMLHVATDKRWLVLQIQARQKAKNKLPNWYENHHLLFPKPLSVEQSSSEATAQFKANLVCGKTLIDATGGMGVDSLFFAKKIKNLVYIEQDFDTAQAAKYNFGVLGVHNVSVENENCIPFLERYENRADWLFLDPARRTKDNQVRVSQFADCEPDIKQFLPLFFKKADKILIKASPLIDIKQAIKELENVEKIYVVAVQNECKELLFILNPKRSLTDIQVVAVNLPAQQFEFEIEQEKKAEVVFSGPKKYLYEPNVAVLKAGAFKSVANAFGLSKIAHHSHLYTSDNIVQRFCGRSFEVLATVKADPKAISPFLTDNRANVSVRNFPMGADELRIKLKIKDGGEVYLVATTLQNNEKRIVVCRKTQNLYESSQSL